MFLRILILFFVVLVLKACATAVTHHPVPEPLISNATVMNSRLIRFWGDEKRDQYHKQRYFENWIKQRTAQWQNDATNPEINFLALSGGGEDGSFAAGFITGWTRHGDRPNFDVITGVSAGALASPLVFLGPKYDEILFEVYENLGNKDIYRTQIFSGIFGGTAILDTRPLENLIAKYVTAEVLHKIGKEHLKGRRLWIGTTNLDAGRPVIWDIGEIALSNKTNALKLVHKILLASSAVPGVFPPVIIDVEVDGQKFTELHVDGGVTRQAFFYPPQFIESDFFVNSIEDKIIRRLYIIRNGKSQPVYNPVKTRLYSIAMKSLSMTIENKAIGDLYRIYEITSRDGIDYNLAIIPNSFDFKAKEAFDPEYTKALFDLGYKLSKNGYNWLKAPPDIIDGK
jgi:hypothetical protein